MAGTAALLGSLKACDVLRRTFGMPRPDAIVVLVWETMLISCVLLRYFGAFKVSVKARLASRARQDIYSVLRAQVVSPENLYIRKDTQITWATVRFEPIPLGRNTGFEPIPLGLNTGLVWLAKDR